MLKSKRQIRTRNDGWLDVYRAKSLSSDFGAPANVRKLSEMEHVARLSYSVNSRRQEDVELAERVEFNLSLKVNVRHIDGVDAACKAVIDGTLYDIAYIDADGKTALFLYLQEVGHVDTQ